MKKLSAYFLLILVLGGVAVWLFSSGREQVKVPQPEVAEVEQLSREVLLYFADSEGLYLVSEYRQIEGCEEDSECIGELFSALVAGPQGNLLPILPAQAKVLGVELRDDLAVVDFNSAFVHSHPGGSLSELLTVYGLVNSLAVNFSYLKQLQILVEGKPVTSLKGHVGLEKPVLADFSYGYPPANRYSEETINE